MKIPPPEPPRRSPEEVERALREIKRRLLHRRLMGAAIGVFFAALLDRKSVV